MRALSFKRHRFPAEVIRYAVWLYFRFTLELPRRRRTAGPARDRGQLRHHRLLDDQVRPANRQEPESADSQKPQPTLAPRDRPLAKRRHGQAPRFERSLRHNPMLIEALSCSPSRRPRGPWS